MSSQFIRNRTAAGHLRAIFRSRLGIAIRFRQVADRTVIQHSIRHLEQNAILLHDVVAQQIDEHLTFMYHTVDGSIVTISGVFAHRDSLLGAIGDLKEAGVSGLEVMMPIPDHEILDAIDHPKTGIGWISLAGGVIIGLFLVTGFFLWTHAKWGIITGGKPAVSLPPFVIVGFEMLVLFTGIATLMGIFYLCRLQPFKSPHPHTDPRVTEDHYMLIAESPEDRVEMVAKILADAGAEVRQ